MDNSKNLVIGLSVGVYSAVQHIESFIVSLRKYYDGPVCMIIDEKSDAMVDFLKKYDVDISFVKTKLTPESVMYNRWVLPRKILIEKYKDDIVYIDVDMIICKKDIDISNIHAKSEMSKL